MALEELPPDLHGAQRHFRTVSFPITRLPDPESFYFAAQHFLYFTPLPQGQGSLRPIPGGASLCTRAERVRAILARGSRLCLKKRFSPSQR